MKNRKFNYIVPKKTETPLVPDNKSSTLGYIFEQLISVKGNIKTHIEASIIKFTVITPRETEALLDEVEQRFRENNL